MLFRTPAQKSDQRWSWARHDRRPRAERFAARLIAARAARMTQR